MQPLLKSSLIKARSQVQNCKIDYNFIFVRLKCWNLVEGGSFSGSLERLVLVLMASIRDCPIIRQSVDGNSIGLILWSFASFICDCYGKSTMSHGSYPQIAAESYRAKKSYIDLQAVAHTIPTIRNYDRTKASVPL
jgi:hypothetical protein